VYTWMLKMPSKCYISATIIFKIVIVLVSIFFAYIFKIAVSSSYAVSPGKLERSSGGAAGHCSNTVSHCSIKFDFYGCGPQLST
jgi:hypothetical protein